MSLLEDAIERRCLMEDEAKISDRWFSASVISDIPYIAFPGFTEYECQEIQTQAQNVLRAFRIENEYKEVAIVYDMDIDIEHKEYRKVFGSATDIQIAKDIIAQGIIDNAKKEGRLAVIIIHNHSNDSTFLINDLLLFDETPSIKVMEILNKKGEAAFLIRPDFRRYGIVSAVLVDDAPEIRNRMNEFKASHDNKSPQITDITTSEERKAIYNDSIQEFRKAGIYVSKGYINKELAQTLDFSGFAADGINKQSVNSNITNPFTDKLSEGDLEYEENGEDGYDERE